MERKCIIILNSQCLLRLYCFRMHLVRGYPHSVSFRGENSAQSWFYKVPGFERRNYLKTASLLKAAPEHDAPED